MPSASLADQVCNSSPQVKYLAHLKFREAKIPGNKAPNSQTPSSKETPSSKLKNRPARRLPGIWFWGLGFEICALLWSLGFGAWCFARRRLKNSDMCWRSRLLFIHWRRRRKRL